ncbi:phospholipid carrier-dependent glycosyltransferase [Actinomyces radicidentis]|uniref:dolichyl-phosphate-mannose--protein mannosyltransferase n=1 Tax=Actinomyces radicidentis TaxID=111015 RepID=UPI0028F0CC5F|nr:phospholipid carrier-dependent glycosyltransferase [Actinomyces radicidentis]
MDPSAPSASSADEGLEPDETTSGRDAGPATADHDASSRHGARSEEERSAVDAGTVLDADGPDGTRRSEDGWRERLGLRPRGAVVTAAAARNGWIATLLATLVATLTRFIDLGHPHSLMFDEIYYVKDAYALWHNGYESTWNEGSDALFAQGDFSGLTTQGSYVVHPEIGKWLIGLGGQIFGWDSSFGWRFMPALAGVLTVLLLCRLTMRLTRSPLLVGLAGLFLAIDGEAITESRIGLLDIFIGFFATLSVYCLVRDREWFRERLARNAARADGERPLGTWFRPWLLATGISLGLTCSIKWSGAYLLAAIGILVVCWDTTALRAAGRRSWALVGVLGRGAVDFLHLVPVAFVVYVAGWFGWFLHPAAYDRGWAQGLRAAGETVPRSWLPDALNDLLEYHLSMYHFHVTLDSTHPYMSQPIGWLVQWRPTSFYWPSDAEMAGAQCGSDRCIQAITSIGNIPVWWSALVALVVLIAFMVLRDRDWRAWAALIGYVGLYLPWFNYTDRTIFTFYTVAFVPFVVLCLTLVLGSAAGLLEPVSGTARAREEAEALEAGRLGEGHPAPRGAVSQYLGFGLNPSRSRLPGSWTGVASWRVRSEGLWLTVIVLAAAILFAILWYPIWTGQTVSYDFWHWHMVLPSWM